MKTIKNISVFVLLVTISTFSLEVKAQDFNYTWDNQSGCDWHIQVLDGSTPPVPFTAAGASATAFSGVGTVPSSGCILIGGRTVTNFKFLDPNCACEIIISAAGGTVTTVATDCAAQGCTPPCHPSIPTTVISVTPNPSPFPCASENTILIQ